METHDEWYESIKKDIYSLKERLTEKEYQMYELEFLLHVAKRVSSFSSICSDCYNNRQDISNLLIDINDPSQMTVVEVKNYGNIFRRIIKHLENQHKLVKEGIILRSVLIGFTVGVTPGAIITLIGIIQKQDMIISIGFVAVSVGIFIGIWRGLKAGRTRHSKVQKEDRFI